MSREGRVAHLKLGAEGQDRRGDVYVLDPAAPAPPPGAGPPECISLQTTDTTPTRVLQHDRRTTFSALLRSQGPQKPPKSTTRFGNRRPERPQNGLLHGFQCRASSRDPTKGSERPPPAAGARTTDEARTGGFSLRLYKQKNCDDHRLFFCWGNLETASHAPFVAVGNPTDMCGTDSGSMPAAHFDAQFKVCPMVSPSPPLQPAIVGRT